MLNTLKKKIYPIIFRNRIILSLPFKRTQKNRVNLHWYALNRGDKYQNFGDWLSVPVFEYMCKIHGVDNNIELNSTKHLYSIGSIIDFGWQSATIWGSGLLSSVDKRGQRLRKWMRRLDIRCVRGPLTKEKLRSRGYHVSNVKMGDPGILMPLIYSPNVKGVRKKYGVISHKSVNSNYENEIKVLTNDWKKTIDEICSCELIISSSLHGIIIAEAYGIPAILLNEVQNGDLYKYEDYYFSTGRKEFPICNSLNEAFHTKPAEIPDFTQMRADIISCFPKDLWN